MKMFLVTTYWSGKLQNIAPMTARISSSFFSFSFFFLREREIKKKKKKKERKKDI